MSDLTVCIWKWLLILRLDSIHDTSSSLNIYLCFIEGCLGFVIIFQLLMLMYLLNNMLDKTGFDGVPQLTFVIVLPEPCFTLPNYVSISFFTQGKSSISYPLMVWAEAQTRKGRPSLAVRVLDRQGRDNSLPPNRGLRAITSISFEVADLGNVAIGKPERHVRKASHCGSKQQ